MGVGGGGENTFFSVILFNFQKSRGGGGFSPSPSAGPDAGLLQQHYFWAGLITIFRVAVLLFISNQIWNEVKFYNGPQI